MADQRYPDGEFAKQAMILADRLVAKDGKDRPSRDEYRQAVVEAVRALQGYE